MGTKDALSGQQTWRFSYNDGNNDEMTGWTCHCSKICAVFYWDKNYQGDQLPIPEGDVRNMKDTQYNKWNDKISSIKVKSGCRLNAYKDDGYKKTLFENYTGSWGGDGGASDEITSWTCHC